MAQERYISGVSRARAIAVAADGAYDMERVADRELVQDAQDGIERAFAAIVDRYHGRIYSLVYRICGSREAEDLTQEVFLRALGRLHRFKPQNEASLRTWLYRIAMNLSINELRRMQRRRQLEGPSLDAPIYPDGDVLQVAIADSSSAPDHLVERAETRQLVHAVIRQLPAKHQQVLVLVDLEGMEYEEAAGVLGCRIGTIKSRLSRARDAFAVKMKACLAPPGTK